MDLGPPTIQGVSVLSVFFIKRDSALATTLSLQKTQTNNHANRHFYIVSLIEDKNETPKYKSRWF